VKTHQPAEAAVTVQDGLFVRALLVEIAVDLDGQRHGAAVAAAVDHAAVLEALRVGLGTGELGGDVGRRQGGAVVGFELEAPDVEVVDGVELWGGRR
jgi:hypothetical protein